MSQLYSNFIPLGAAAPAIHFCDLQCKFCLKSISRTLAKYFGSPEAGYMCLDCVVKEQEQLEELARELGKLTYNVEDVGGMAAPCVVCNSTGHPYMRLVYADGKRGFVCPNCERRWVELHRQQIGPAMQHKLKLK